jgi:hypothetical protein
MHTLKVSYRPDNYPDWVPWREFSQEFTIIGIASALGLGGAPSARAGFSPRTSFGKPADDVDSFETGRKLRRGFNFQVRFQGSGHVILDRFRLHAQHLIERSRAR